MARFMAWHVEYFRAEPKGSGRSSLIDEGRPVSSGESILVFISFEKKDAARKIDVVDSIVRELSTMSAAIGVRSIVLNPFAHLFGDLANPQDAMSMLTMLEKQLLDRNFSVQRLAFGIFYEIELKAKGHKLSRMSREI